MHHIVYVDVFLGRTKGTCGCCNNRTSGPPPFFCSVFVLFFPLSNEELRVRREWSEASTKAGWMSCDVKRKRKKGVASRSTVHSRHLMQHTLFF